MKTLKHYKAFLDLKKPVNLTVKTKHNASIDAFYIPVYNNNEKLKQHKIVIYADRCQRSFEALLAHELIHAKQEELGDTETHGHIFKKYASKFSKRFNLKKIYVKALDI